MAVSQCHFWRGTAQTHLWELEPTSAAPICWDGCVPVPFLTRDYTDTSLWARTEFGSSLLLRWLWARVISDAGLHRHISESSNLVRQLPSVEMAVSQCHFWRGTAQTHLWELEPSSAAPICWHLWELEPSSAVPICWDGCEPVPFLTRDCTDTPLRARTYFGSSHLLRWLCASAISDAGLHRHISVSSNRVRQLPSVEMAVSQSHFWRGTAQAHLWELEPSSAAPICWDGCEPVPFLARDCTDTSLRART